MTAPAPTGPALSPMLLRLAGERATGTLSRPTGTLWLADGAVVHAESPFSPALDLLLTAAGRIAPGVLTQGAREVCRLGALFDAAYFALAPGSAPTRFRYGVVGGRGDGAHPVSAGAVERECARRRELLDRTWPYPALDTAPVLPRELPPGQRVTRRQQAVLECADGLLDPAGIARRLGRPAFHTLLEVRRMAAAGLVDTPDDADTGPVLPAWIAGLPAPEDPDIALLRRLRDALEAHL
ncbi:transcriptional regulator [Streptomyces sp. NPDC001941]|uniref:transcriptional regulator n=1 Tax=Streptomyces sp. NPDC001941 TaxID=3154659 RepID=UPI0033315695